MFRNKDMIASDVGQEETIEEEDVVLKCGTMQWKIETELYKFLLKL